MNISFSTTAYVICGADLADAVSQELGSWAEGTGSQCVSYEEIISWMDEIEYTYMNDNEKKVLNFLVEVKEKIAEEYRKTGNEVGDIVFSK